MDNPLLVSGFKRLGNLPRHGQGFVEGNRRLGDAVRERRTFHQFQNKARDAVALFKAVDGPNVRMIQRSEDLRFP